MRVRLCLVCFASCLVGLLGVLSGSRSRGRVVGPFPLIYMTRHNAWCIETSAILALFLHET